MIRAADIHARIGGAWPTILAQLGIAEEYLRPKKAGPCPVCGGRDRYVFDNRKRRGDFICRQCGAGDGFELLHRVHGWTFSETRRRVLAASGLRSETPALRAQEAAPAAISTEPIASPSAKVHAVARSACAVADSPDAVAYLESRGLWPLPDGCALKAHPSLAYWGDGTRERHPGLVADVRDVSGDLVTVHVTYLRAGRKLDAPDCRKLLTPLTGRDGCAVRLLPSAEVLGIAEGIETALSAAAIDSVPVWAALNTSLLGKFEPPVGVALLRIYADDDAAGLKAACRLMERLQGRARFELRLPTAPHKDFNEQLLSRNGVKRIAP